MNQKTIEDSKKLKYYYSVYNFCDNMLNNSSDGQISSVIDTIDSVIERACNHQFVQNND